ncbi:hypothetical protein SLE2022_062750 [Rubroshorea leprosula]
MEQHGNWHQISSVGTGAPPSGTGPDAYFNSFPPGFRFKPTDLVLVQEYLNKKLWNQPLPPNRIHEVDIYKFSPQELSVRFRLLKDREEEWYFFTPREKKYKNGSRPDRSTVNGYWKPTGVKVKVIDEQGKEIGERRSLEFWEGRQPNGKKTSWKMHEYEVPPPFRRTRHDMLLDECILVKIYNSAKDKNNEVVAVGQAEDQQQNSIPSECNSTHSISVLFSNQLPPPRLDPLPPANELLHLITGNQDMHGGGDADVATLYLEFESASSLDYESAMKEGQNQCSSTNQQHSSFFECAFDEEELASDFGSVAPPPLDDLSSIVFSSNVVCRQSDNSMAATGKEESV